MIRRRLSVLGAAAAAALVLAGCSTSSPSESETSAGANTLQDIQEAGVITVGTEGTYRPFSFHEDGTGDLTGYDVEIVIAVAEKLGVEVRFEETQWDAMFAGLEAGRFDVIANQVTINEDRQAKYELSDPYTTSTGVVVVAADNNDISSVNDLAGKTAAESLTTNWYALAESAGANVQAVEGWAQAVSLLEQGRVDATINDELTVLDYQANNNNQKIKIAAETGEESQSAFAFQKGSEDLVEAFNGALEDLRTEGVLAEISEKYFGADVSQ